jgi:hypothetical protein
VAIEDVEQNKDRVWTKKGMARSPYVPL